MGDEENYKNRVSELKNLLKKETEIGFEILKHLLWIEDSRIFLDRGFASLYAFCTKELGMSENQAFLRITAVREMRHSETVKEKLQKGEVSVAQIAVFANAKKERKASGEKVTKQETDSLFDKLTGKSVAETKKIVHEELLPNKPKIFKVSLELNAEEFNLFQEFKAKHSHSLKDQSHEEGFRLLLKQAFKKVTPSPSPSEIKTKSSSQICTEKMSAATTARRLHTPEQFTQNTLNENVGLSQTPKNSESGKIRNLSEASTDKNRREKIPHTRHIPEHLIRALQTRSQNECEYTDPFTHRKCNSRHFLQIDHIHSFSRGGSSLTLDNLQMLCANHNRRKYERAG